MVPGIHSAAGGAYSDILDIGFSGLHFQIQTATASSEAGQQGDDLVILVTSKNFSSPASANINLLIQGTMLFSSFGNITSNNNNNNNSSNNQNLIMTLQSAGFKPVHLYSTAQISNAYFPFSSPPFVVLSFAGTNGVVGLSTGSQRSLSEIQAIINSARKSQESEIQKFGNKRQFYEPMFTVVNWKYVDQSYISLANFIFQKIIFFIFFLQHYL